MEKIALPYHTWAEIVFAQLTLNALRDLRHLPDQVHEASRQLDRAVQSITFDRVPEPIQVPSPAPTWNGGGDAA